MDDQTTMVDGQADAKTPMRRRLGRGLNALLGGGENEVAGDMPAEIGEVVAPSQTIRDVATESIERNPFQPRKDFDKEALQELAESLITHGVLQPLLVRPAGSKFQLIAGERRWLAAKEIGLETVPCRVLELEDKAVCEVALVENVQRKDLSDLEKAQAFQDYLDKFGGSVPDLAKQLGMNRSTVANFIRLLSLSEPVKQALGSGQISNGHARALVTLDESQQFELCQRIQQESLSVRKTEDAVKELQGRAPKEKPPEQASEQPRDESPEESPATVPFTPAEPSSEETAPADEGKTAHVISLENQLRETLGTKIEIRVTGKDEGRITVHFGSNDEFERLVKALRGAAPHHEQQHAA